MHVLAFATPGAVRDAMEEADETGSDFAVYAAMLVVMAERRDDVELPGSLVEAAAGCALPRDELEALVDRRGGSLTNQVERDGRGKAEG